MEKAQLLEKSARQGGMELKEYQSEEESESVNLHERSLSENEA